MCWSTLNHVVCSFMQDLQDRVKKEAKKEMDERGIMERDEAAAAREDDDYQVSISYSSITQNHSKVVKCTSLSVASLVLCKET